MMRVRPLLSKYSVVWWRSDGLIMKLLDDMFVECFIPVVFPVMIVLCVMRNLFFTVSLKIL